MSYFMDIPETRMNEIQEKDLKEIEPKYYDNFFAVNPRLADSGQIIPDTSFIDRYSYSRLHTNQSPFDIQQNFPFLLENTPEVDDSSLSGFYSLHTPDKKKAVSYATHIETPTSQQEFGSYLSVPEEDAESIGITKLTSLRIPSRSNFEENLNLNEQNTPNVLSFHSPVEHQLIDQLGEIYPRGLDYQQLSDSLQTPPCRNSQYQVYSNYCSLTPPEYSNQTFPSLSWLGHDSPSLAMSERMVRKKASKNTFEQCSLKAKSSCESINNNEDTSSEIISTISKQPRHYLSVADISSAYQRRKQINRHKIGQYRSVSPCLQICKRKSAKGLNTNEPCGRSVGKGLMTSFVNYTPEDSEKILTGVAPSGSNKTKARRDREALIKRQKLSQAALRAIEAVGGDISGLVEEDFFIKN